jgi:hypothetical protein
MRTCADIGHAVAWFGSPVADGAISPRRHDNLLATHRGCPGSTVHDEAGGVVQVIGAPLAADRRTAGPSVGST